MKTAVNYLRFSCDSQTEQSIEGQQRVCQEYAKRNDILIVGTYIDRAMTGTNDNRPDFQRMIKDSAKREWDYVLVYKFDRFSRNKYETAIHKKTLRDNGVKVLSATECIPDTPEAIIFESMLEGMAEYYSLELSQKVRRGMNESRHKGNFTGGFLLYGYKTENKKVIIDEEQANTVRYIFEQYSAGVYVKDIINALTAKGILNHGKPFARNTVYNILRNEKYSGIYHYNGELFDNIYPQIVPTDLFEKVRRKIEQNKYGKRSVQVVYLLRNKLKCGYCGEPVSAECGTAKNGEVKRYYKCLGRKHNNGCKKEMVRKEFLEDFVLENVIAAFHEPSVMDKIVRGLLAEQEKEMQEQTVLQNLIKEKQRTEKAIENMVKAIERGVLANATAKRLKELENMQEELEKQIILEKNKNSARLTEEVIRKYYSQALKSEPALLINTFIKEILLYDDKIVIYYNSPKASPDDNRRGFSFVDKFAYMPQATQNKIQYRKLQLIMAVV